MANFKAGKALDVASRWGLAIWRAWPVLFPVIVGLVTGRLAEATAFLEQYGPVSWIFAGIFAALIVAAGLWVVTLIYERFQRAQWLRMATTPFDGVNPLETTFTKRRIDIQLFKPPIPAESVRNKTFVDCELVGPANVFFTASNIYRKFHGSRVISLC